MKKLLVSFVVGFTAFTGQANAGPYSDALGKCMVASSSEQDKIDLVRWIVSSYMLHPAVADLNSVTPEQRETISKTAGELVQRLLTVACKNETRDAIGNEGLLAITLSFQALGQVAAMSVVSNPNVLQGVSSIGTYASQEKIQELLKAP